MVNRLFLSTFVFFSLPLLAFAEVTICKNGNLERRIEITSTVSDKKVPCEVKYFKEGDEAGKTLWNAQNDAEYCEKRANEFTEKLSSLGWQCSKDAEAPSAPSQ